MLALIYSALSLFVANGWWDALVFAFFAPGAPQIADILAGAHNFIEGCRRNRGVLAVGEKHEVAVDILIWPVGIELVAFEFEPALV